MAPPMQRSFALAITACLAGLVFAGQSSAFNYVSDSNGTCWGIQDFAPPRVDTGSIRATQVGAGPEPRLQHDDQRLRRHQGVGARRAPRFNGELMRGFGLDVRRRRRVQDDARPSRSAGSRSRARSWIKKDVPVGQASYGRWLDTFTQHDGRADHDQGRVRRPDGLQPVRRELERAGQHLQRRRDRDRRRHVGGGGDAAHRHDARRRPAGDGDRHARAVRRRDDVHRQLAHDTFNNPLAYGGHEGNFQAYVNTLTLAAGRDEVACCTTSCSASA